MAERKIDYFGTFLDSMKRGPQTADAANEVLKALRGGGMPAKDLIPIAGNSVTRFFEITDRLVSAGWVTKMPGDVYALTDKGHEIAAVLG
jgi:predicted transcriptional regulator